MIIESRHYRLHPGKLQEYLACFLAAPTVLELLRPHLAGFWVTESGELNTVQHLWRYKNRVERAAIRTSWATVPAMADFISRVTPTLQQQRSDIYEGEVLEPLTDQAHGVFDRFSVFFRPSKLTEAEKLTAFLEHHVAVSFDRVATLRRRQFEMAGQLCELQLLLRSDSLAQRDSRWRSVEADVLALAASPLLTSIDNQLLMAVPFSPWQ